MGQEFLNVYEDCRRAEAYSKLEFPGTYFLAYRDLPEIINKHVSGRDAVDFGCGAGRSTRFLKRLGFNAIGVDISEEMLSNARDHDPEGDYRHISSTGESGLSSNAFDIVLSVFTFDNVPMHSKTPLFAGLGRWLKPNGCIVNLVSTPEIYINEWASFSTKEFEGNRTAKSGDKVMTVMLDVPDRRPIEDILCTHEDYLRIYSQAGLTATQVSRPLGNQDDPIEWVSEENVAPWAIYVLRPNDTGNVGRHV